MTVLPLLLDQLHQLDLSYAAQCDDRLLVSILLALAQPTATPPQARAVLVRLYTDDHATNDDKEEAVRRIASEVAWICTAIFALTAHTVSCTPAQSAQAFLRALFPSETGWEAHPSSQQRDGRTSQQREAAESTAQRRRSLPRRHSSVPLAISVQAANERSLREEVDIRTPTKLPRRASRSKSQDASSPLSQDQFFDAATFSDYTGPNPEDGDSSAGEDLYPTSTSPTATSFRSAAMSRRIGSADSVSVAGSSRPRSSERRRSSARGRRRYSVSSPTRSRALSQGTATEGIGLGLATPTRTDDSRPGLDNGRRPSGAMPRRRSDSVEPLASSDLHADPPGPPGSSALPPHMQPASYLQQAERRPSIASIQTAMQDSRIGSTSRPVTSAEQTPIAQERRTPLNTRPSSPSISFASPPASPPRSRKVSGIVGLSRRGSSTHPPLQPARVDPASNGSSPSTTKTAEFAPEAPAAPSTSAHTTRALPQVLIVQNLERARPSVQDELLAVLRDRRVTVASQRGGGDPGPTASSHAASAGPTDSPNRLGAAKPTAEDDAQHTGAPSDSPHDPSSRRRQAEKQNRSSLVLEKREAETWNLPDGFLCVAIVCVPDERGSRARAGRNIVSRYLLDRFSLSYSIPLETVLASDSHLSSPALHPLSAPMQALLLPLPVPKDALPDYISDSLDTYISDLVSALRHHPRLDARMLTARAVKDLRRMTGLWAALTKGEGSLRLGESTSAQTRATTSAYRSATASSKSTHSSATSSQEGSLIVLPADVLAVLVSVLSHRLSVRDPRHEASLFWGSTIDALEARYRQEQATVEDLIREVVAVV